MLTAEMAYKIAKNSARGANGFFAATTIGTVITGATPFGVACACALGTLALEAPIQYLKQYIHASWIDNWSFSTGLMTLHTLGAAATGAILLGLPIAPVMAAAFIGCVINMLLIAPAAISLATFMIASLILGPGIGLICSFAFAPLVYILSETLFITAAAYNLSPAVEMTVNAGVRAIATIIRP